MDWKDPKPAPEPLAVVQDFVNTRSHFHGSDMLATTDESTTALTALGLLADGDHLDESDRQRLVAFREALRGLLLARSADHDAEPGACAKTLDELTGPVSLRVRFSPDGRPALQPTAEGEPVDRAIGRLLTVMATAEAEGNWKRLKACRNEGCRWAFYDASRNRSGRWCDMNVCGVRHKLRAYRERQADPRTNRRSQTADNRIDHARP
jgi:predicted RNA-binding Zn ribbon-like protein